MTQTIVNLGTGGALLNGRNGSTTSADTNDAKFLDWPGDNAGNYVYLPGVTGNYLSVPDEAALDITGDIDIRVQVAMDDWTPAAEQVLLSKFTLAGNQKSYRMAVTSTGLIRVYWSVDGSAEINKSSTISTGLVDGSSKWIRATIDVNNDASGNDVSFFLSDDGSNWTQLGSTVTTAGVTSIFSSTAILEVGAVNVGANFPSAGKFYRAQVFNGIDGTKVLDVDTSVLSTGASTTFAAVTGQTVTINRSTTGKKSVAVCQPTWLFGTNSFMEVANDALLNFTTSDQFSVVYSFRVWNTPANFNALFSKRLSVADSFNSAQVGYIGRILGTGSQFFQVNSDTHYVTATRSGLSAGFRTGVMRYGGLSANSVTHFLDGTTATSTLGGGTTFANSLPFRVGANGDPTVSNFGEFELYAIAVFRRLITDAERDAVVAYFTDRIK